MHISKLRLAALAVLFAVFFGIAGAVAMAAVQNHMLNARSDLYSAKSELEQATANKGGHRVNAMNLIDEAIKEVNLGIQYAQ